MKKHLTWLVGASIVGAVVLGTLTGSMISAQASNSQPIGHGHSAQPAVQQGSTGAIAVAGEQLLEAADETSRFDRIHKALQGGYANINVFFPNMGCHYLNSELLDETFDHKHPELLVYAEEAGKAPLLVALEYAVPISESPNNPPEGFAGDLDVWTRNEAFGLWTLHAWVRLPNPDGVFAPDNPLVTQTSPECGTSEKTNNGHKHD
jgi:hypothetical protein